MGLGWKGYPGKLIVLLAEGISAAYELRIDESANKSICVSHPRHPL